MSALSAAVAAALTMTACGGDKMPTGPSGAGTTSPGTSGGSPVVSVSIAGAPMVFAPQQTMQFEATAQRQDGTSASCTSTAVWETSNSAVVTVAAGLARGVAEGQADIRATCGSATAAVHITIVVNLGVTSVYANPSTVSLAPGQSQQLQVVLCSRDGICSDCTSTATYELTTSPVFSIDAHGLVTALAVGDGSWRVHCGPPFTYATIHVRLPDDSFSHRVEFSGALCGDPNAPGQVSTHCSYGGDSTEVHQFIDVARAGSMQILVQVIGGHDYGDSLDLEVRCGDRLLRTWSVEQTTVSMPVEPCRYDLRLVDKKAYGERYRMVVQYP
jgi:hypothetical protein